MVFSALPTLGILPVSLLGLSIAEQLKHLDLVADWSVADQSKISCYSTLGLLRDCTELLHFYTKYSVSYR
jgi:hypothetical protein